jgi:hypothetical protein
VLPVSMHIGTVDVVIVVRLWLGATLTETRKVHTLGAVLD